MKAIKMEKTQNFLFARDRRQRLINASQEVRHKIICSGDGRY